MRSSPPDEERRGDIFGESQERNSRIRSHRRFALVLSIAYGVFWTILAINPVCRSDWALENIVVVAGLVILVSTWHRYTFSRSSYFLIALFLTLHAIGSHYTYSEVPYRAWIGYSGSTRTGSPLTSDRNHYDRFVHFAYGLLLFYPFRESFLYFARVRRKFWSYLVPLSFVLSTSLIYELLEWGAAVILGGEVGIAFLGSQGDTWDAQKDSACAFAGAAIAVALVTTITFSTRRDMQAEWIEFLTRHTDSSPGSQ